MNGSDIAGQLKRRIIIQEQILVSDGAGGFTRSWQDVASVWAQIEPFGGREQIEGEQLIGTVTHRILIRYRNGITAANRLIYGSRSFNIRRVLTLHEAAELMEILAEEGVAT